MRALPVAVAVVVVVVAAGGGGGGGAAAAAAAAAVCDGVHELMEHGRLHELTSQGEGAWKRRERARRKLVGSSAWRKAMEERNTTAHRLSGDERPPQMMPIRTSKINN